MTSKPYCRKEASQDEIISYEGKINDYLKEKGYRHVEYKNGNVDEWHFKTRP
jgi:hypothetical protein